MAILTAANLGLSFGDHRVLDGINFTLSEGEHVGLVGRNGCGKSTLMKLAAGLDGLKADTGHLQLARNAVLGYLTQDPELDPECTLRQEAAKGYARLNKLHEDLERVAHEMGEAQGDRLDALLKQYEDLEHQMHAAGGYSVDHEIDATLHGVGLDDKFFEVKVKDLSGGQKGRLALAKLLISQPDILLLDEPTNHLDIAGREWLEQYLHDYKGAVMLVSHDRWLLDRVVDKIYEIEVGKMFEYPGNYHQFVEIRNLRRLSQQREFDKQQDHIKREQGFIDRYRAGQRAKQAQGRQTRLERFKDQDVIDRPLDFDSMALRMSPRTRCGDMVIVAENVSKAYENKTLFHDLTLTVKRGDCLGIIGPNGAGKSTLVRCLLGEQPADEGVIKVGNSVEVGHFKQSHEYLDQRLTVIEYMQQHVESGTEQAARDLAGAFLFTGIEQEKPLNVLSGGERARAVLATLMCHGPNLLVLDEPTNHLDMDSAERLEEAIARFTAPVDGLYPGKDMSKVNGGGTLILITHDRALLDALVTDLLILDGQGNARFFHGKYSEFVKVVAAEKAAKAAATASKVQPKKAEKPRPAPQQASKPQPSNRQQQSNNSSPLGRMKQDKLEAKIAQIETEIKAIDTSLADAEVYRDRVKFKSLSDKRDGLVAELAPLEEEWMRRAETV
jgi:ATP-binding cassette subfamily F protein 3